MEEIEEETYMETLRQVLRSAILKYDSIQGLLQKDKAIKYAASRGYEATLIYIVIKEMEESGEIS